MATTAIKRERFNIYLPRHLAEKLRERVPERERTRFVVDLIERELRRIHLQTELDASFGAWSDEDHPELAHPEDLDTWLADARRSRQWDDVPPPAEGGE